MEDLSRPRELLLEPDTELVERDQQPFSVDLIRGSKVVTTATHARCGKFENKKACLFVAECKFIPDYRVRFKYVEVELRVVRSNTSVIAAYQPHAWEGKPGVLPIQYKSGIGGKVGASEAALNMEVEKQSERSEVKRASVMSILDGSTITWYLRENDMTREGVPQPFKMSLVVETDGPFSVRISYQVKLSKSGDPLSWRSAYARLAKPLALSQDLIDSGYGPTVDGIDKMETASFDLVGLAPTNWDV